MKATLYIESSLNGKMTEGQTNSSWVSEHDEIMFARTCQEIGCVLVGRQTFDQYQGVVYPVPETQNVVLTSNQDRPDQKNVTFRNDLSSALQTIEDLGFDRFVVVGGAQVIKQCLDHKIVDQVLLSLHPYIFGNGLSIVGEYEGNVTLEFEAVKHEHKEFLLVQYKVIQYK